MSRTGGPGMSPRRTSGSKMPRSDSSSLQPRYDSGRADRNTRWLACEGGRCRRPLRLSSCFCASSLLCGGASSLAGRPPCRSRRDSFRAHAQGRGVGQLLHYRMERQALPDKCAMIRPA